MVEFYQRTAPPGVRAIVRGHVALEQVEVYGEHVEVDGEEVDVEVLDLVGLFGDP